MQPQQPTHHNLMSSQLPQPPTTELFTIMPPDQPCQHLQVTLAPKETVYLRGALAYSNHHEAKFSPFGENLVLNRVLSKPAHMHPWTNNSQQMQVIGITHLTKRGSVLVLDLEVYRENLYISAEHILASRVKIPQKVTYHKEIPNLFLVENEAKRRLHAEPSNPVAVQSNSGIIEKYLSAGQEFILYPGILPVAMSETVTVTTLEANNLRPVVLMGNTRPIKLKGPGWLFFESSPVIPKSVNISRAVYVFFGIYVVMMLLGIIIVDTL